MVKNMINTNKTNTPKVSVIMPVFNGSRFVGEAIESILNQTFKNFELIIIDDCSTDNSVSIINAYKDTRIKIIQNNVNIGSTASRNKGLVNSQGEYIAILDCDDIALSIRLEEEVNFLDKNPDFGVVGGWTKIMNENGVENGYSWKNDLPPEKIPSILLFKNYITHSSSMIRREAMLPDFYKTNSITAGTVEDYELWIRIARNWKICNLQKFLIKHRQHPQSLTKIKPNSLRQQAIDLIYSEQLQNLNIKPTIEELKIHQTRNNKDGSQIKDFITKKEQWLRKLIDGNSKTKFYEEPFFSQIVADRWFETCNLSTNLGINIWQIFWRSPISKHSDLSLIKKIKFLIKCLKKI